MPPQSFLIVLQSGGEISPARSNLSSSDPLRSAARSDQAISIQSGDAQRLHRKKFAWRAASRRAAVLTRLLRGDRESGSSAASLWVVSNTTADPALRGFPSRRWFLLCALTCTDARGPVFTPTQLLPAGGVGFHHLPTRDITDRRLACVHQCPLSGVTTVFASMQYSVYVYCILSRAGRACSDCKKVAWTCLQRHTHALTDSALCNTVREK